MLARTGGKHGMTYGGAILEVSNSLLRDQQRIGAAAAGPATGRGGGNLDVALLNVDGGHAGRGGGNRQKPGRRGHWQQQERRKTRSTPTLATMSSHWGTAANGWGEGACVVILIAWQLWGLGLGTVALQQWPKRAETKV